MLSSLPPPTDPTGTSSGEVTPRYNLSPCIARWGNDLTGENSVSKKRKSQDIVIENDNFVPPLGKRTRRNVSGQAPPIVISDADSSGGSTDKRSFKKLTASQRKVTTLTETCSNLRASVKKLEKEVSTKNDDLMRLRVDREAEKEVVRSLKEKCKDTTNPIKIDDSG